MNDYPRYGPNSDERGNAKASPWVKRTIRQWWMMIGIMALVYLAVQLDRCGTQ